MTDQVSNANTDFVERAVGKDSYLHFLRNAYRLMSPFWQGDQRLRAWLYLIAAISITLGEVSIAVGSSFVYADLMDALKAKDIDEFNVQALLLLAYYLLVIAWGMLGTFLNQKLVWHWRRWLTQRFSHLYMSNKLYNQLELKDYGADNPDQRMAVDILSLCSHSIGLGMSFLSNIGRLATFGAVLWVVSGALEFSLWGVNLYIPGYMFWTSFIYAGTVTWLTHKFANPMVRYENERQSVEADFRFQLVRVRDNAESIALIRGEKNEISNLKERFSAIWSNYCSLLKYDRRLKGIFIALGKFTYIFPVLTSFPGYLAGNMTFGGILQVKQAFTNVTNSLEWFAFSYAKLAEWKASVDRVLLLEASLSEAAREQSSSGFHIHHRSQPDLVVRDLNIHLPDGRVLLKNTNLELLKGKNVLVTGTSGAGKSTFFRAISGLWVWGSGEIFYPQGNIMFAPQRPYLPVVTLREALCYPLDVNQYSNEEIITAMRRCDFGSFVTRLDEIDNWSRVLSGGEQQRVAFVRALLTKPDWLLLDEATSALDPVTEALLYSAVAEQLPNTTIISIAHRDSLRKYHQLSLKLNAATQSASLTTMDDLT